MITGKQRENCRQTILEICPILILFFKKNLVQREISKIVFENVGSEGLLKDGEDESKVFVRMIR